MLYIFLFKSYFTSVIPTALSLQCNWIPVIQASRNNYPYNPKFAETSDKCIVYTLLTAPSPEHSATINYLKIIMVSKYLIASGGLSSLIDTAERIKSKIPVVVMSGTGRAADLIGSAKILIQKYESVEDPE